MKTITLEINVQELQTVFQALGNLPYIQVQELIGRIQQQVTPQLQNMNDEAKTEKAPAGNAKKAAEVTS